MLKKERTTKTNVVILVIIAAVALVLSIVTYQYSTFTSNKIVDIASQKVISDARIEVHDISQILANKLQNVGVLLETLSDSPAIHNNEYKRADNVINARQDSSSDLTDFYMWLNKNGKINWISNINETTYQKYKGTDLSYRPYFIIPKYTHTVYYSSLIQSNDRVPRLYISYPVINTTSTATNTGKFTGVVVASIKLEMLGNFLKNQIFPQFNSTIGLLDRKGTLLYTTPKQFGINTNNEKYVGEYVFGDKFQSVLSSLLPPESKNLLNDQIKKSLQGNTGSADVLIKDKMNTIAYQPVVIGGKNFLTLYILAQHTLTNDVSALIDQQKYITILEVIVIGVTALIAAFLLFSWNKRLETTVNVRTAELKRANDSLASANEQLKIHDKMQKEFINIAAHELRTPTQSIVGYSELLEMEPERSESYSNTILRNAKRLHGLINDILDVTRIESQSLNLSKEQFNLKDLLLSIVRDFQQQIERDGKAKDVNLEYRQSKDDTILLLHADKQRITQVISNLIDNAIKFTNQGTISIVIDRKRNSNSNSPDEVIVSVKDTGSGIHPDILPRLFSKFASRSFQGTGLGLFISKSIIEAHGGKIWGENNPDGRGATFTFSVPIDK